MKGLITDPEILASYNEDSLGTKGNFKGVIRPESENEVREFIRACASDKTPVTAQGLRSSLTGASICLDGVALSLDRMNRLIDIDVRNQSAFVGPGLVVSEFKDAVEKVGFMYPPDPTSAGESTIGGNVATNASGSRALKYGSTIDWVRGLRVVNGNGEVIQVKNSRTEKICAGYGALYKPANIFVGSEGTLGIITQIEVALALPAPPFFVVMSFFRDLKGALDFTIETRDNPDYSPTSIEFFDRSCLEIIGPNTEGLSLPPDARAMVYFEQEYENESLRDRSLGQWGKLIERHTSLSNDTQIALNNSQKRHLFNLRHLIPSKTNEHGAKAVKTGGGKISSDWTVPYKRLPQLFNYFDEIRNLLGDMQVIRFGHIGAGHPHFNFIARNAEEKRIAEKVDTLMAIKAVQLGGCVTGEHGIGKLKREHLALQYPTWVINAMKAIKRELDPEGILAPGNIFD